MRYAINSMREKIRAQEMAGVVVADSPEDVDFDRQFIRNLFRVPLRYLVPYDYE